MNTINLRHIIENQNNIDYPIWHPYSSINKNIKDLTNFVRGEGVFLYDANGKRYLDSASGLWNISLGYNNENINKKIIEQLEELPYCSMFENTSSTGILAANRVMSILPEYFKKVFFTCSGSESTELAIKIMRQYWYLNGAANKNIILSLMDSYHGTYYGSMSISGIEQNSLTGFAPLVNNISFFKSGVCSKCEESSEYPNCGLSCLAYLEDYIKREHEKIAGIILEPLLASKGVIIFSKKYLDYLQFLCDKYNLLLAVDEVAVGFFRTGTAFYFEKFKLKPDIVCMGKGINSGYLPLGAVALSSKICDQFLKSNDIIVHGSTQAGNLLACAASIAAIDQYKELKIWDNVLKMGSYLKELLINKLSYHRNIGEIRGEGLIVEVELVKNNEKNNYLEIERIYMIKESLRKKGLIIYMSDVGITILPMLIVDISHIDFIVNTLEDLFCNLLF